MIAAMVVDETRSEFLETVEARKNESARFTWTVPGLAVTAQAFLLTVALRPDSSPTARLVVAVAGIVAILGSAHFMAKQVLLFDLYEAVIEAERRALGLPGLRRDALEERVADFDGDDKWVRRGWHTRRWLKAVVHDVPTIYVWLGALGVFFLIDFFLAVHGLTDLIM